MARGLNNEQKLQVQELVGKGVSTDKIAKRVGITDKALDDYLSKLYASLRKIEHVKNSVDEPAVAATPAPPPPTKPPTVLDLLTGKTRDKGNNVAIATQAGSERVDAAMQKARNNGANAYKDSIIKVYPDSK